MTFLPRPRLLILISLSLAPAAAQASTTAAPANSSGSIIPAPAAAAPPHAAPLPESEKFSTVALAAAHCPGDTVVWSSLNKSHSFHTSTSRYYGKTKHGAYVCKSDAVAAGYHQAKS